jgi:hypothetical protein
MSEHPDEQSHQQSPEQSDQQDRVDSRAELLPEERAAGSENPHEQAEAILAESDERTEDPVGTQQESVQSPNVRPDQERSS